MKLVDALYHYDTRPVSNDSRFGDSSRDVSNISEYIRMGRIDRRLWRTRGSSPDR